MRKRAQMPKGKRPQGATGSQQRQHEKFRNEAEKSGHYGKRAGEVAARFVVKQHLQKGHLRGR